MRAVLGISERLYGLLLYLYPQRFRAAYGQQMRQTFRDACGMAHRRSGVGGVLALWPPTLLDLLKSALEERAQRGEITMFKARLMTMAGPFTVLVGVLWLLAALGDFVFRISLQGREAFLGLITLPFFLSFIPLLFALLGIRLRFHLVAGGSGKLGLTVSVAGGVGVITSVLINILLSGMAPEAGPHLWVNYTAVFSVLSIRVGFILFGLDVSRNRLLPRWNWLPLLLGLTVVLSLPMEWFGVPAFLPTQWASPFLHFAISGVCWLLFGLTLLGRGQASQATAASF
ncbi:MAG: hypothetical protein IT327_09225 [Anaerolineae bacterium]|nr:hypothetical protein [Anaerolineae bacterium]